MSTEMEAVDCDLCSSNNNALLLQARDFCYGHSEMSNIVKCKECGLIYLNPRPTFEAISKLYDEDYTPDNELNNPFFVRKTPKWKIVLRRIWYKESGYVDNFPHKGKVLDFGCGKGSVLEILEEEGCEAWGLETNPKSVMICNKKGLNVVSGAIEKVKFPDNFFDAVIMSQVFEHLPSPKRTLEEIKRIIKPKGRIFIYCPNVESYLLKLFGKYWQGWHIPFHFYNFSKQTIFKLANDVGFDVRKIDTATPPPSLFYDVSNVLSSR